ncbi:MAG TPA: polyprenyl synthetase family protein [Terriglobales bacterium]|nr:polyprenyl synthetase family protein [Terriglobales bacterium]
MNLAPHIAPADAEGAAISDPFALVRDDLALVELELESAAQSPVRAITEIADYLRQSGGKRIRPAVVLLTARLAGCETGPRVRLAAVAEMIHAATLVHDDIIDAAETRRGRASTNARWGNAKCVLAGDWLYMEAFAIALRERHFEILEALISLTQSMVEGELMQLDMQGQVVSAGQHLELIERKTARLFEVGAQLGALSAGAPAASLEALAAFGRNLGLAFQMVDDILDFTADAAVLGKPVGNDLREGKMTLPAIYAYAGASAAERDQFEQVMRDGDYAKVPLTAVQAVVAGSGALARAQAEARACARQAADALAAFPPSPWRAALASLAELVIARSY